MKNFRFFSFLVSACILFCTNNIPLWAETRIIKNKTEIIQAVWNDSPYPGDPVFIFVTLKPKGKFKKQPNLLSGEVTLIKENPNDNEKPVSKGTQFILYSKSKKSLVYVNSFPLTTYVIEGDYKLNINFSIDNERFYSISDKLHVIPKDFVKETIPLDSKNTGIRTNYSKERMDQIKRLNEILFSVNDKNLSGTSTFVKPTSQTRRTSFFGDRRLFVYSDKTTSTTLHYGIDFGVPEGTEVLSCGAGKVVMAENRISTGWSVCIEHMGGLYSLYYHMSELKVSVNDQVVSGQLIGLSGATGLATGPHLHWEMRLKGEAVNPDWFTDTFNDLKPSEN